MKNNLGMQFWFANLITCNYNRGKCRVFHYQDILEAKHFKPFADTFFCILTYNPDARRLANTQGEIRVGASHQAKLPVCAAATPVSAEDMSERCEDLETSVWRHAQVEDADLLQYLQAARSLAAFAGICDRGNDEDMYEAAQSDATTIYALQVLHDAHYDTSGALQFLAKNPVCAQALERRWTEEEQKKFVKGLRQYGKNFFRIRKELLPHRDTSDLIEYYYLWKKTPQALTSRPTRRRITRPSSSTNNKKVTAASSSTNNSNASNGKKSSSNQTGSSNNNNTNNNNANNVNSNNNDQYSGSEVDSDNNESDESSDNKVANSNQTCCTNCFTSCKFKKNIYSWGSLIIDFLNLCPVMD